MWARVIEQFRASARRWDSRDGSWLARYTLPGLPSWVSTLKRPQIPPDSLVASGNKVLRDKFLRGLAMESQDGAQCKDERILTLWAPR